MNEAYEAIAQIRDFYPDLVAQEENLEDGSGVSFEFREQAGLSFSVTLLFYDDILQIETLDFVAEFFPFGEIDVRERFVDAACGLFDGRYRLVYFRRRGRLLKVELQAPATDGWERRYSHYQGLRVLWPWLRLSETVVQNVAAA